MIKSLKSILGLGPKTNYAQLIKEGAIILDVRSQGEFASGHISKSLNIPVDSLKNNLGQLKDKNKVIITCCASGIRSGIAKGVLKSSGYANVINGGSWSTLKNKIK
ncbi:MAG: rhodanese-like domain-containing protein [Bacteroidetes bacterium]|nr:rhodanese-like domain-containing protein [Bacteroidota bacterium]